MSIVVTRDETLTTGVYNGVVNLIIRKSDGYVNASKMIATATELSAAEKENKIKHLIQYLSGKHNSEYIEAFYNRLVEKSKEKGWNKFYVPADVDDMIQKEHTGYSINFRGVYVHPQLTHLAAEYVSVEYRLIVTDIMEAINAGDNEEAMERVNKVQKEKEEMQKENERLRQELEDLETNLEKKYGIIQDLTTENDELKTDKRKLRKEKKVVEAEKDELKEEIYDKSVRSDLVLTKMYWVKLVKKDDGFYYVSHDQKEKPQIGGKPYAKFGFTGAGVIREDIRKHFNLTGPCPVFHENELAGLIEYIGSLNPKMEIFY